MGSEMCIRDSVTATENATVEAESFAASLGLAFGGAAAFSFSGAGADAINDINNRVDASISNSTVSSSADVDVLATNTSSIDATVVAVSAAVSGGTFAGAGSIGASIARNRIGDLDASNANRHRTTAAITDSSVTATTDINVIADANETIETVSAAGAVAIAVGIGAAAAGSGAEATSLIAGDVSAIVDGSHLTAGQDVSVHADSQSQITRAEAVGAALAVSLNAASVAVSLVSNDIQNEVTATISGDATDRVSAGRAVVVDADATRAEIDGVLAVTASVSGGLRGLAGGGIDIDNTINNTVTSTISGALPIRASGVSVRADEDADVSADAAQVTVSVSLGAALGVALVDNRITSTTVSYTHLTLPTILLV